MQLSEKTNGSEALEVRLTQPVNGRGLISMPEEFGGMYQAGYEAGFASGRDLGYRQGYEAGFWNGRRLGDSGSTAAPAAVENAAERVAATDKSRLFGLPCTKCRRLMYSEETRCPYCKAPRAARLGDPPSATSCGPEEESQRETDGGLSLRMSREK